MQFSILSLFLVTFIVAVAFKFMIPHDAFEEMERIGARTLNCTVWDEFMSRIGGPDLVIAKESSLVRTVIFQTDGTPRRDHIELIGGFPNIENVIVLGKFEAAALEPLGKCKNLKTISFRNERTDDSVISYCLKAKSLETIYVGGSSISDAGAQNFQRSNKIRTARQDVFEQH